MVSGSLNCILNQMELFLSDYPPPLDIAIKINLQSPPLPLAPRTDASFLEQIIDRLLSKGYSVTLVEGADGHLRENISAVGLGKYLDTPRVKCIDLDTEDDVLLIERGNRQYPIPRVLLRSKLRLAAPCATKRHGYLFSCNVKTFVGILPRSMCQNGTSSLFSRPMIHEDLEVTVSDLYGVVMETVPFQFYLNGGNTISEFSDIRTLPRYYCSNDPIELDEHIANILQAEIPPYLVRLKKLVKNR